MPILMRPVSLDHRGQACKVLRAGMHDAGAGTVPACCEDCQATGVELRFVLMRVGCTRTRIGLHAVVFAGGVCVQATYSSVVCWSQLHVGAVQQLWALGRDRQCRGEVLPSSVSVRCKASEGRWQLSVCPACNTTPMQADSRLRVSMRAQYAACVCAVRALRVPHNMVLYISCV